MSRTREIPKTHSGDVILDRSDDSSELLFLQSHVQIVKSIVSCVRTHTTM